MALSDALVELVDHALRLSGSSTPRPVAVGLLVLISVIAALSAWPSPNDDQKGTP